MVDRRRPAAERPPRGSRATWRSAATSLRPSAVDTSATARLSRLLHILPRAARDGGASISELARELGVNPATVHADVRQVQERAFYLPPGSTSDIRIELEADRVRAFTTSQLQRPIRLSRTEALTLGLGLRLAALSPSADPDPEAREALRRRLEAGLAAVRDGLAVEQAEEGAKPAADLARTWIEGYEAPGLAGDPSGVLDTLARAARDRTPCRIRYVKPAASEPEERTIHPYAVLPAEGHWYVTAHCCQADAVRHFRMDRIAEVVLDGGTFDVPADFDPWDCFEGARVFRTDGAVEVLVRYGPRVARRVAEVEDGRWTDDGAYLVRHPVADDVWLVRLVLGYGGNAEVLEPPELRATVREAAERLL